jgi:hypothetical protein
MWKDTKAFRVLSNYHSYDTIVVYRKQRDGTYIEKSCPKTMADYSKFMGGVDTANQLRSYYEGDRRSKKLWHCLFYALLETSLVRERNALVLRSMILHLLSFSLARVGVLKESCTGGARLFLHLFQCDAL